MYYSWTTLSTVGFGDFHPKSDIERVGIVFIMVIGVCIFRIMMDEIQTMIYQFKKLFFIDFEQNEELNKFFGVLARFNGN